MRLDLYLVEKSLAPSRSKAQELIKSNVVQVFLKTEEWKTISQASYEVREGTEVRLLPSSVLKFVSRGGLKLEGALEKVNLDVKGFRALDIGQSTGGFTDCLLQKGADVVLGIDVGTDQLHESLKNNPKVFSYEGIHIQELNSHLEIQEFVGKGVDLCVVDVSFISIKNVLSEIAKVKAPFYLLGLVKPQFEVGREALNKGGIVKDPQAVERVLQDIQTFASGLGFKNQAMFQASISGGDGNQEYFLFAQNTFSNA